MKKNELLNEIVARTDVAKKDVKAVMEVIGDVVIDTLSKDKTEKIALENLGTFRVKTVPARSGKIYFGENKGGTWTKPEHDEICFKMSKSKKELA